jgi:MscS family membrane protein
MLGWMERFGFDGRSEWMVDVVAVLVAAAAADFVLRRLLQRVLKRLEATANPWDDALLDAARTPLILLIWVLAISVSIQVADRGVQQGIAPFVPRLRDVGVVVCVAWFAIRWVGRVAGILVERRATGATRLDLTTIHALRKLGTTVVLLVATVTTLETLGFDLTAVVAVGGIGGVALGFASQDVVSNFFGGLMIYVNQPFGVGDWIRSPDREIEGTVEEIGWYATTIRTFDSRPLYVPNSIFTGISVENPARMQFRRIYETIGVRYDDFAQVRSIVDEVYRMLEQHPEIESEQKLLMVNFDEFGDSSLNFFVYTFTKTRVWKEFHRVKQDVLLRIGEIVEHHGAEVAFPTRTLHLPDGVRVEAAGPEARAEGR